jgi:hypothetical protein
MAPVEPQATNRRVEFPAAALPRVMLFLDIYWSLGEYLAHVSSLGYDRIERFATGNSAQQIQAATQVAVSYKRAPIGSPVKTDSQNCMILAKN